MKEPLNDLERALVGGLRAENHPALYRLLRESDLVCLTPYHPEFVGKAHGHLPRLNVWKQRGVKLVPVFTSEQRAEEALQTLRMSANSYAFCIAKGVQIFGTIAAMKLGCVLNPTHEVGSEMAPEGVRQLADGSMLKPLLGVSQTLQVKALTPAEYPIDLVQPLFNFLRLRPEVRAVWIFQRLLYENGPPAPDEYSFGFLAEGDIENLKQEFMVVALAARAPKMRFTVCTLNLKEPWVAGVVANYTPFYAAPDYPAPNPISR